MSKITKINQLILKISITLQRDTNVSLKNTTLIEDIVAKVDVDIVHTASTKKLVK